MDHDKQRDIPAFIPGEGLWLVEVSEMPGLDGRVATISMSRRHAEFIMLKMCRADLVDTTDAGAARKAGDRLIAVADYLTQLAEYTRELGEGVQATLEKQMEVVE